MVGERIRQFQGSIEAIQHKVSQINPALTRQEIDHLRGSIDRAHLELITIDRRIDEIAQQQLSAIEVDGVEMRAQKLAELVASGRDRHGWFDDAITLSPMHAPPLVSDEASRLREARRALREDLVYVTSRIPSADSFPSVTAICDLHDVLVKRGSIEEEVRAGELAPLKANTPEVFESARILVGIIEEMIALTDELGEVGQSWPFELRKRCGHASFASERSALESLFDDLDELIEARAQFLKFPVLFPNEALQDAKMVEAVTRAVEIGKPFGFLSIGVGDAKEHIAEVRVQGRAPASREDWQKVKEWIALHEQVLMFETRWNALHEFLSVPAMNGGVTSLRQLELVGLSARKAHRL